MCVGYIDWYTGRIGQLALNFKMIFNTKKKQRINRKTKEKYINFDSRCPRKGYPMKKKKKEEEEEEKRA